MAETVRERKTLAAFKCKICRKRLKTKGGLNIHVRVHFPDTYLFKCPECDFSSVQKSNYSKHLAVVHGKGLDGSQLTKDFSCSLCSLTFFTEAQLKQHELRKHSICKQFKCDLCNYETIEKAALTKHFRIKHTGQRPYSCTSCCERFATASSAARHRRSHGKERPYPCPETSCDKIYADLKRLKEHLMTHKNLKPFQCDFCSYSSNRKDNLKLHVRRNHTDEKRINNPN